MDGGGTRRDITLLSSQMILADRHIVTVVFVCIKRDRFSHQVSSYSLDNVVFNDDHEDHGYKSFSGSRLFTVHRNDMLVVCYVKNVCECKVNIT